MPGCCMMSTPSNVSDITRSCAEGVSLDRLRRHADHAAAAGSLRHQTHLISYRILGKTTHRRCWLACAGGDRGAGVKRRYAVVVRPMDYRIVRAKAGAGGHSQREALPKIHRLYWRRWWYRSSRPISYFAGSFRRSSVQKNARAGSRCGIEQAALIFYEHPIAFWKRWMMLRVVMRRTRDRSGAVTS